MTAGRGGPYGDGRGPLTRAEAMAAVTALSDTESHYVLRHVAALAPEAVGAAVSELRAYEAEHGPVGVVAEHAGAGAEVDLGLPYVVALPGWLAERLAVLDPAGNVARVLVALADHAQQGVYRPGAWERDWLIQAFGAGWLAKVEPDPESTCGHVRPRK